jgi:hypothetical protein
VNPTAAAVVLTAVPLALAASCSGSSSATTTPGAAVEDAVRSYSSAYLRGDGPKAYDLLSARCKKVISLSEVKAAATGAAALYGQAQLISVTPIVDGDRAFVTYRFTQPAIDQETQPWAREADGWRRDKC